MLTCPVCLTPYNYARGSNCPDCLVKLKNPPSDAICQYKQNKQRRPTYDELYDSLLSMGMPVDHAMAKARAMIRNR
jgi:hypothetical protein